MNGPKLASLASVTLTIFLITACSGGSENPDAPFVDAPTFDARIVIDADTTDARPAELSCLPSTPPTTAPDPLNVDGRVAGLLNDAPINQAVVSAHLRSDNSMAATFTTGADGLYALSIATGGNAWDGYLKVTHATLLDTYIYPPTVVGDHIPGADVPAITADNRDLLAGAAGVTIIDPLTPLATIAATIVDCNGDSVIGATMTVNPAGSSTVKYIAGNFPSSTATETDSSGVAVAFNVPNTGPTTVTVDYNGQTFSNTVTAWPNSIEVVIVAP